MNPSTALATVVVDELVRGGVREAVLSPGSRNAPLSYALHEAYLDGRLRLHVRVDERTAAFLALGLAKASGIPVPVVCTSGTAAANLHPAVLEASHAGVALLALTADRPVELHGSGANQTTDQIGLYGGAVRSAHLLTTAAADASEQRSWRAAVCRALATAAGELDGDPGPVHVNIALREPLVPDQTDVSVEMEPGRPDGGPWTQVSVPAPSWSGPLDGARALGTGLERTLVVVGDCPAEMGEQAGQIAARRGWPLVAEPSSGASAWAIPHGPLLLSSERFLEAHKPQRVLVVGRPTLARPVQRLLSDPDVWVEVVTASPRWPDPPAAARAVHHRTWLEAGLRKPSEAPRGAWVTHLSPEPAESDLAWAAVWRDAGVRAAAAVADVLEHAWPSGPSVARDVLAAIPRESVLVLGSSSSVRDVDLVAAPRADVRVFANRGLAGIDGTVSTAVGVALAAQRSGAPGGAVRTPAYALLGDLTFLHDANGLLLGPGEPRPDLCIVVVNDDGGGIFGVLEQGAPEHARAFERVFATPTGADLAALCAAMKTPYTGVRTRDELASAVVAGSTGPGIRVVEVRTDRSAARELHVRLRAAVADALTPLADR